MTLSFSPKTGESERSRSSLFNPDYNQAARANSVRLDLALVLLRRTSRVDSAFSARFPAANRSPSKPISPLLNYQTSDSHRTPQCTVYAVLYWWKSCARLTQYENCSATGKPSQCYRAGNIGRGKTNAPDFISYAHTFNYARFCSPRGRQ